MILALDSNESREFVSTLDNEETKTIFILGVLDNFVRAKIEDMTTRYSIPQNNSTEGTADIQINYNQRNLQLVRYGLKGWRNFKDAKGVDVIFETIASAEFGKSYNIISERTIKRLPRNLINELAVEILNDNQISIDDKKK